MDITTTIALGFLGLTVFSGCSAFALTSRNEGEIRAEKMLFALAARTGEDN